MGCNGSKEGPRLLRRSPSLLRRNSDVDHIVSLTSSTLGSLSFDPCAPSKKHSHDKVRRVPRTPTETPPNEPEHIDAWELMAGLEAPTTPSATADRRSFSFCTTAVESCIVSTFKKAMNELSLSPEHPILLRSPERGGSGFVRARVREFQDRIDAKKASKIKVVLYFTSLRGVRKTYEDCCWVRETVRGYGVRVDEKDVSMDLGFREEVRGAALPRVFVDGRCLGGVEEVRRMHEGGELGEVFDGCEMLEGKGRVVCEGCGDVRFVPCKLCSGSCKVYVEEEEEEETEEMAVGGGFRQCLECNENGVVRCPVCCY